MDRKRLHFATMAFVAEMRRQAVQAGNETAIKSLDDYPPEQREALKKAVGRALNAADPAADESFKAWLIKTTNSTQGA